MHGQGNTSTISHALGDELLMERFLEGDDSAYAQLFGRYESRLLTYLRTILREHPEAADDMFQETFVRLYRQRKKSLEQSDYEPIKNVRSWLFRVAHNLAISYLRRRKRSTPLGDSPEDQRLLDERTMVTIEESFSNLFHEEDPIRSEDLHQRLRECVELLPAALREIYVLKELNGLPYEEVTQIADCSYEAARMRLSRARRALRQALEPYLNSR